MRRLLWLFLLFFYFTPFWAQHYQLSVNFSAHTHKSDFYLSERSRAIAAELSWKSKAGLAAGIQYDFGFKENNPWYLSFICEFSDRTYSYEVRDASDTTLTQYTTLAYYLDVRQGISWYEKQGKNSSTGATFYVGAGVPLLTKSPKYAISGVIQPYAELDFNLQYIFGERNGRGFLLGISPYVRAYLRPLYQPRDGSGDQAPFYGFGASLKIGFSIGSEPVEGAAL